MKLPKPCLTRSFMIMSFLALAPSAHAQQVTLKVAHFLPPVAPAQQQVLQPWCDTLAQESGGRIACQIYPAMQLGGTPSQLVDQVRNRVADVVWTAPGYSAGRFPAIEALELPFVVSDGQSGSRAAWTYYQTYAQKEFAPYKVLAVHVDGGVAIHTANRPVAGLADMKGLKLRTSNRLSAQTLTALGGTPVAMPPAQVTEAISKGVVDGAMAAWEVVRPTKLDEVAPYHAEPQKGLPYPSATVLTLLMNKDAYASLPDDLKAVIDRNSGLPLVEKFGGVWDQVAASTREKILSSGGKITTLSAEQVSAMRQAAQPVEDAWIKQASDKGLDGQALARAAHDLGAGK